MKLLRSGINCDFQEAMVFEIRICCVCLRENLDVLCLRLASSKRLQGIKRSGENITKDTKMVDKKIIKKLKSCGFLIVQATGLQKEETGKDVISVTSGKVRIVNYRMKYYVPQAFISLRLAR